MTFAFTTLVEEPGTAVALVVILPLDVVLDLGWKRSWPHPLPRLARRNRNAPRGSPFS